jgi:hypothetical protein
VAGNSVDYLTHLVHLVEGINIAYDQKVGSREIKHFNHLQHNLILNNEEFIDDMRCEACVQFIISGAPFYRCTQYNFFSTINMLNYLQQLSDGYFIYFHLPSSLRHHPWLHL